MELCEVFAENMELWEVLPNLWSYAKFCQKYRVYVLVLPNLWSYASFAKFMELYEILPKIWNYVKFCQKYRVMS
jgi:hypothetical protein